MNEKIIIVAAIAVAAAFTTVLAIQFSSPGTLPELEIGGNQPQIVPFEYEMRRILIEGAALDVEIADDSAKIQRGLMFRETLPENQGMLFMFDRSRPYQFWMMNVTMNLDIIWINSDEKVVHIVENAEPCRDPRLTSLCTFSPDEPARYVLEVNAGFVARHGITEESRLRFLD